MKLYEISDEYRLLIALIDHNDGEITSEVSARLEGLQGDLKAKVAGICAVVKQFEREGDAAEVESKRLAEMAQHRHRAADRLKSYLKEHLERIGEKAVKTDLFSVRIQANGRPSIQYAGDPDKLPDLYKLVSVKPNTQIAYDHWREGIPLPAGFTVEKGTHLRIS